MISLDEVPDEARVASPYMCGSVSPDQGEGARTSSDDGAECLTAFKALEDYLGEEFHAAITTEIGGGNTAVTLWVAARRGIPIVDVAPAGRSVPGLQHTTFYIKHLPIAPLSVATAKGDVMILEGVSDDFRAEAIVRAVAAASGNRAGVADHPLTGWALRKSIVPGTLSKALHIGETVRQARSNDVDPVQAAELSAIVATTFERKFYI